MSAGARVREVRKARGLTQKVLAGKAGCSQQTIVDLETGNVGMVPFYAGHRG